MLGQRVQSAWFATNSMSDSFPFSERSMSCEYVLEGMEGIESL